MPFDANKPLGGRIFNAADFAPYTYPEGIAALATAVYDHVLNALSGTSTTSLEIGNGSKSLTIVGANGQVPVFKPGARLILADQADPATNAMTGILSAFNNVNGAATMIVDGYIGSGTKSAWYVNISGEKGVATGATSAGTYIVAQTEAGLSASKVARGRRGILTFVNASDGTLDIEAELKPENVTGTTHTQTADDFGKLKRYTNAAGCAVTALRPHDSSGAPNNAPTGRFQFVDAVGGPVTVSPATGTITAGAVTGLSDFLFPKGSFGFVESQGGDVLLAHILRRARPTLEVTASTLTVDRSHDGALIVLNRSGGVAVTLPETDDPGIGEGFEVEFQSALGQHAVGRAGTNVIDKAGGATQVQLAEGQGLKLRSNGGTDAAGIWRTNRGMSDLGAAQVIGASCQNNASTPNTQFDLDCDAVVLRSASNGSTVRFDPGAALTCDTAQAGPVANGRDQSGAFSNSSWVHFYWIWNGSTLATIASTAAPPTGPALPDGYSHWAYAGAVYKDGSGNLVKTMIRGCWCLYQAARQALSGGNQTSEQTLSLSALVPPNTLEARIEVDVQLSAGGGGAISHQLRLRCVSGFDFASIRVVCQTGLNDGEAACVAMPVIGQQIFWVMSNNNNVQTEVLVLNVQGYKIANGGE